MSVLQAEKMSQEELTSQIDSAIVKVTDHAKAQVDPQKCVHFTQAVLNLAHAKLKLLECKSTSK